MTFSRQFSLFKLLPGDFNSLVMEFFKVNLLKNIERKPALLDNITQILNAPMFVLIEFLEIFGLKTKEIEEWKV
jgi:uncharacterized membrane protein YGL010W